MSSMPPPPPPLPPPGGGGQGPYGQPGYGAPPPPVYGAAPGYPPSGYGFGYGQPVAQNPFDGRAKTVLWLGILSLVLGVFCLGLLLGPVAWGIGSGVRRDAIAAGWPEPSENRGGRICGIIATVFLALGVVFFAIIIAAARSTNN